MSEKQEIKVTSYPLTYYKIKGVFALAVILSVMAIVYIVSANWFFMVIAFLVLALPSVNFLFPSTYVFSEDSFERTIIFQKKVYYYDDFASIGEGKDGILLFKRNNKPIDYIYIFDPEIRRVVLGKLKDRVEKSE